MATAHARLTDMLDSEFERLHSADSRSMSDVVSRSIDRLATETRDISRGLGPAAWSDLIHAVVDPHPIVEVLMEDPYTARARRKPRGYAGDAEMMDYCYSRNPPDPVSALGRAIFLQTTASPNAESVRIRRSMIAERIDKRARTTPRPNIMALACGHLREAELSSALRTRHLGRMIALDQDDVSLSVVKEKYGPLGVECVSAKVKSILAGELQFSDLDLVYAAGLFDYLDDASARLLVRHAFGFLRPGGELLIGNFLPDTYGCGYMEAFMQWRLITRNETQIISLGDAIEPNLVASKRYFQDDNQTIGYLSIAKA